MNILGLSSGVTAKQHDPSAALICGDQLVAVCEEERFMRVKSGLGMLPIKSIQACLKEANLNFKDIDIVVHSGITFPDLEHRIRIYLQHFFGTVPKVVMVDHQLAHMASAFYCSNFEQATGISCDGWGDQNSLAIGRCDVKGMQLVHTRDADNESLGAFYEAITSYLGFTGNEDEYKVMGLAPYGEPGVDLSPLLHATEDGYWIDPATWFREPRQVSKYEPSYGPALVKLLGPARSVYQPITQRHKDIAYAVQLTLEKCLISVVKNAILRTGYSDVVMAGGVALNCSANLKLKQLPEIGRFFVQPAASDRGVCLGAALMLAAENGRPIRGLKDVYLGPRYADSELENALILTRMKYTKPENSAELAAKMIAEGKIIAWCQGRSEFGPRALGNRSILADPREARMKDLVNSKIKFREEFRPFAPAVLLERSSELFEMQEASPFMTVAFPVRESWKSKLQAVTHVNGTARVQTVDKESNPKFHALISEFAKISSVPAVLNTSFNVRGQPIVESAVDAIATFAGSGLDALFLGPFCVEK